MTRAIPKLCCAALGLLGGALSFAPHVGAQVRRTTTIPPGGLPQPSSLWNLVRVTSLADGGPGTLRAALDLALQDGMPTRIEFTVGGNLFLATTLPPISDQAHPTVIDGSTAPSRVVIRGTPAQVGSALLVGSSDNELRALDFVDIEFDVISLTDGADRNRFFDVDIRFCRYGTAMTLLGADDNVFEECDWTDNPAVGAFVRDGAQGNHFGPGLTVARNRSGGIIFLSSASNTVRGTSVRPVAVRDNGSASSGSGFGIAAVSGSSGLIVGPEVVVQGGYGDGIKIASPLTTGARIQGVGVRNVIGFGITVDRGASNVILEDVILEDCSSSALLVKGRCRDVVVRATVPGALVMRAFASSSSPLLSLQQSSACEVQGAVLEGRGTALGALLLDADDCRLTECDLSAFSSVAISIGDGSDLALLQANRIRAGSGPAPVFGVQVRGLLQPSVAARVTRATVRDNELVGCTLAAILVQESDDAQVLENDIRACPGDGVRVVTGAVRTTVRGNLLVNTSASVGAQGLQLNGSRDTLVEANRIEWWRVGLIGTSTLGGTIVRRNTLRSCSQLGMNLQSAPTIVECNLIQSCEVGVATSLAAPVPSCFVNNTYVCCRVGHDGGGELWNNLFWFQTFRDIDHATFAMVSSSCLQLPSALIGFAGNFTVADPLFLSPLCGGGDFRLLPSSPLVDRGSSSLGACALPALDHEGSPRLQGAGAEVGMDEVR
ncbi:MAG: right-handed parallel beta-helix repeat-containing protein [Planctomycetes bacterium]|nr:right-handed parallel beta-helix repeat-containing protein [Planctomycetota bacterium]